MKVSSKYLYKTTINFWGIYELNTLVYIVPAHGLDFSNGSANMSAMSNCRICPKSMTCLMTISVPSLNLCSLSPFLIECWVRWTGCDVFIHIISFTKNDNYGVLFRVGNLIHKKLTKM